MRHPSIICISKKNLLQIHALPEVALHENPSFQRKKEDRKTNKQKKKNSNMNGG